MTPSSAVANAVSCQSSNGGPGANPIYWIRQRHTESWGTRSNKVSTKILGFGIFMVGVILLTIALILGLQFPSYVSDKIRRDMCIFDRNHMFFDKWVRDTMYVRWNRVYHWTLVNTVDFIAGQPPLFAVKGPYIYKEKRTLINVNFTGYRIAYKTMYTQTFDVTRTRQECGSHCSQHDQVTVINTEFLNNVYLAGGLDGFVATHVSSFLLQTVDVVSDSDDVLYYTGCVQAECRAIFNVSHHSTQTVLDVVSLGSYIEMNDTNDKRIVLTSDTIITTDGHIHLTFIKLIYNQLINSSTAHCDNFSNFSDGTSNQYLEIKLADSEFTLYPYTLIETRFNDTVDSASLLRINFTSSCSLSSILVAFMSHLLEFSEWPMLLWSLSVCDGLDIPCTTIEDSYETVLALFNVVKQFVDSHLLNVVASSVMALTGNSLVLTKSQHHVTLGSKPGSILPHHTSITEAFFHSKETVTSNCYHDHIDNNMAVREYNGSQFAPPGVYGDQTKLQFGHSFLVPPSRECRACTSAQTSGQEFEFFIEDIARSLAFNSPRKSERHDTGLYRYMLSPVAFSDSDGECSTINLTSLSGFPLYAGMPCYRLSNCAANLMEMCAGSQSSSYYDVEPRTGRVWGYSVSLQYSTVISPDVLGHAVTSEHSHVTFVNQLVPLYWVQRNADIAQREVEYFNNKIVRLMNASCGGLISLTLVAIVTMAVSIVVGMLSTKKNKVQPVNEETVLSNHRQ